MGQEFNEGEVMRRAKIGKGSVNSVLRRLAQVGVTGRWKRGGFSLARVSRNRIMREAGVAEAEPSVVEGQAYMAVRTYKYTWEQRPYPSKTRSMTC